MSTSGFQTHAHTVQRHPHVGVLAYTLEFISHTYAKCLLLNKAMLNVNVHLIGKLIIINSTTQMIILIGET